MADNKLSVRRVEGVVDGTVAATLSQLLRLTSDAVIVFNMEGIVLLANEEAETLFAKADGTIAGLDVRFLFTPANQENLQEAFSVESLPFAIMLVHLRKPLFCRHLSFVICLVLCTMMNEWCWIFDAPIRGSQERSRLFWIRLTRKI